MRGANATIDRMSETPSTEPTSAAEEITESAAEPSPESDAAAPVDEPLPVSHAKHSSPAPRGSKLLRWVAVAALVLALVSTGLAVAGYFYYPHKGAAGSGTYSDQQTKDAKKNICETFMVVDRAVVRNSHAEEPGQRRADRRAFGRRLPRGWRSIAAARICETGSAKNLRPHPTWRNRSTPWPQPRGPRHRLSRRRGGVRSG